MVVGRVIELWRYPVKSMLGERLDHVRVGPDGVEGDRALALRALDTARVLSAKKVSRLLAARARTVDGRVVVELPTGETLEAHAAAKAIGAWLKRPVEVIGTPGGAERPAIEGDSSVFRGPPGGFFDSSAIHIVTSSTLERLGELHPTGRFDPRRFRPNVVLETAEPGFVEEAWIGGILAIGGAAIEVTKRCSRCVMTTHAQEGLPVDRQILRTVIEHNEEHVGVYGIVRAPGVISTGDEASLR